MYHTIIVQIQQTHNDFQYNYNEMNTMNIIFHIYKQVLNDISNPFTAAYDGTPINQEYKNS